MTEPLATAWFRPAPTLETAWFGTDGREVLAFSEFVEPSAIPAVIGPPGRDGEPGAPGPPGEGAPDPGDLMIYFENGLT